MCTYTLNMEIKGDFFLFSFCDDAEKHGVNGFTHFIRI